MWESERGDSVKANNLELLKEVWPVFHDLWGKAKEGTYDKAAWMELQNVLMDLDLTDPSARDYRGEWLEFHKVYGKAQEILARQPQSYEGWNWVHALVDALQGCTNTRDDY